MERFVYINHILLSVALCYIASTWIQFNCFRDIGLVFIVINPHSQLSDIFTHITHECFRAQILYLFTCLISLFSVYYSMSHSGSVLCGVGRDSHGKNVSRNKFTLCW